MSGLCVFGEVLFDCLPGGRRVLGGAPFNVAWHLAAFGQRPRVLTRVGCDANGDSVRRAMQAWDMDESGLQSDPDLPTGTVAVRLRDGQPEYDIVHPAAWDAIQPPATPSGGELLYHGTLALRDPRSRDTWRRLRQASWSTVFVDINLRAPWWSPERVFEAIEGADWVKLNRDELDRLAPGAGQPLVRAQKLGERCGARGLVLTDGARGASLLSPDAEPVTASPPPGIRVVDTVGAGDALAAVVLLGLLAGWPPAQTLERAQAFASTVVAQPGATVTDRAIYDKLRRRWGAGDRARTQTAH